MYAFLQESQWWSREQLQEYQIKQLEKLLKHAYENVPYYKRVFNERGLKPENIQDFDDLRKLPFLTKNIIRENFADLVATNFPQSKLQYATTGGSTGTPMGFYQEKGITIGRERAFIITMWNRVGYQFDDKCIMLRGNVVKNTTKGKFWEHDPLNKLLILSSYHMKNENLAEYVEKIRQFQPKFIQAYPSAISILAKFMLENNIEPIPGVVALLCGSENLYETQRQLLEEAFQCRIYSWYGNTEQAVLGGECEKNHFYHLFPEYGITELIGKDGNSVTEEGEIGEIVGTSFNNYAMPFIRYKTMDLGVHTNESCDCGRNYSLLKKVEGRLQELIVTKDGRNVTLTAFIFGQHFYAFSNIKEMQLVQEEKGKILVNIVKTPNYSDDDEEELRRKMIDSVDGQLDVQFKYVNEIPRTKLGKFKFLIQKLPVEFGDK
jgi:phenylacetate-CoA ligase